MVRKPLFTFDNTSATGVDEVPVNAAILIEDSDGNGKPKFILLTDKTNLTSTTTINDLLTTYSSQWELLGVATIKDLADVSDSMTPSTNQVLKWDGSEWTAGDASATLSGLTDTDINGTNSLADDDLLQYDSSSSKWLNVSEISGGTY